jgi:acetyl esterase/lipase
MKRILSAITIALALCWLDCKSVAAADVGFESGVEYTNPDNQHLQLNLARPAEVSGNSPAVVCIHGGGFRAGKRERWDDTCKKLAERGYVAATVSYRLAPDYQFPAAIHDVKAAVRWRRAPPDPCGQPPERKPFLGD